MRPVILARLVGLALLALHSPAEDCDVAIEVNEDIVFNHHCSTGDRACVTSRVREAMLAFNPGCASRVSSAGDAANRGTSEGCWLVYQPNMAYDGGGTRVMHQLTGELISQGACVRMAYVHPDLWHIVALTREAAQSVNATEDEVERWLHRGIGALDTIVVPETAHLFAPIDASWEGWTEEARGVVRQAGTSDDATVKQTVEAVEANGGLILRWMLGSHRGWGDALSPRVAHHVGLSHFTHRHFLGSSSDALIAPLEPMIYAAALRDPSGDLSRQAKQLRAPPLVLLDSDSGLDAPALQHAFLRASPPRHVEVRILEGYSREETISLFQNATAFVDLYLPGLERANCEAALFDATPVLSACLNGGEDKDYAMDLPRVPCGAGDTDVVQVLGPFLDVQSLQPGKMATTAVSALRSKVFDMPRRFSASVRTLRAMRHATFITVATPNQEALDEGAAELRDLGFKGAVATALSLFARHALSSLTVAVPRKQHAVYTAWEDAGPGLRDAMARVGVERRLRFSWFGNFPYTDDGAAAAFAAALINTTVAPTVVLLAPGRLAPEIIPGLLHDESDDGGDIGSGALVHGCTVADGVASCPAGVPARTSFQEAREVGAAVIRSGLDAPLPRPPADHFLWSTIAPFLPRTAARSSMFLPD